MSAAIIGRQDGLALVATLVVLALLMALAVPFAVSMGMGEEAVFTEVDRTEADLTAESVRDLLLAEAAGGHEAVDFDNPHCDTRDEYPVGVALPEDLETLRNGGRLRLGGEVWDLQRKIDLNTASPLVLGNLIGGVTRVAEDFKADADELLVEDAGAFPERGYLVVDGELIRYLTNEGGRLSGLTRGVLAPTYRRGLDHDVRKGELVFDYRVVRAVMWPFSEGSRVGRAGREPYRAVGEIARSGDPDFGQFTAAEIAAFERHCAVGTPLETSAEFGRAERVFAIQGDVPRSLLVKSALHLGPGSVLRLRSVRPGDTREEYALVWSVDAQPNTGRLQLPSAFTVHLLEPLTLDWEPIDTVVEPLVPHPVNVNTADVQVLQALLTYVGVERPTGLSAKDAEQGSVDDRPALSPGEASALAQELVDARGDGLSEEAQQAYDPEERPRPFESWKDLAERVFEPRLEGGSPQQIGRWRTVYQALRLGHDRRVAMGTMPLAFRSGPIVGFRAAAARDRGLLGPGAATRKEITGTAVAMPGHLLGREWVTQQALEEAFRLDRQAPFWLTGPINLHTPGFRSQGDLPSSRELPHLVPMAYPDAGFGQPRFPSDDDALARVEPVPSSTLPAVGRGQEISAADRFAFSENPQGHDLDRNGPYRMGNSGPREPGNTTPAQEPQTGDHSRQFFPVTEQGGVVQRFATSFWVTPKSIGNQILFDVAADDPERNRLSLQIRDGELLFEVYGPQGLDPEPGRARSSPDRPVANWVVPLSELALEASVPFHVAVSGFTGRPTGLSLLVDGVPRGRPRFVTYLTAPIPVFDPVNRDPALRPDENPRYDLELLVEDTQDFPERGIVRIGTELFEYTSRGGGNFSCRFVDSMGGRAARMRLREWRPDIPLDENGEPTVDLNDPQFSDTNLDVAPEHPVGAAVELYGYSSPVLRDAILQPGAGSLGDALGAFAVARVANNNLEAIAVNDSRGRPFPVGEGLSETMATEIELADPVPTQQYPPPPASDEIAGAFSTTGGYALLIQYRSDFSFSQGGQVGLGSTPVGGIEVIRYGQRQGNKLTGITRGVQISGAQDNQGLPLFDGTAKKFVLDWANNLTVEIGGETLTRDEVPFLMCYCVPISIPANGDFIDPSTNQIDGIPQTEWVQIYNAGDETQTEWVRYDLISEGHLVRANQRAWNSAHRQLTRQLRIEAVGVSQLGAVLQNGFALNQLTYGEVRSDSGYIGAIDAIEERFPQINACRRVLGHRGDPFTETSSHAQPAGALVTQCHRFEFNWGNYGALGARPGRSDRVALVKGRNAGLTTGDPDWHTVNWSVRRYTNDQFGENGEVPPERFGPYTFQLVAFQGPVRGLFEGATELREFDDVRMVDRMVKFPCGELPSAYPQDALYGGGLFNEPQVQGTVDEVFAVTHQTESLLLDEAMDDGAFQFRVRPDVRLSGYGPVTQANLAARLPSAGGMVMIDGELIAYQSSNDGLFTVATDGRGMLGTQPRGHDEGARVHFMTHLPTAILASPVGAAAWSLQVQSLNGLPPGGGTVLLGRTELLHYTWSMGTSRGVSGDGAQAVVEAGSLEMPRWYDPERDDPAPEGLLRGRYGTVPSTAAAGSAVVWFPFRAWDRYHERADDPELSHFQTTLFEAPVLFTALRWEEELPDALVDVHCTARIDRRGRFWDDPERVAGLFRFEAPQDNERDQVLLYQGSQLELRFQTVYRRGAFDPVTWNSRAWKTAPVLRKIRVEYEGDSRILEQRVTSR